MISTSSVIANGVVHSVHVGGPDICSGTGGKPGCDMNFSLTANEFSDGDVNGRWTDIVNLGPGTAPFNLVIAIDCLHVVDNQAWMSGVIVGPDFTGARAATSVVDIGVSAKDAPDQSSFTIGVGNAYDCHSEVVPPNTFPDQPDPVPFPLFDFIQGQVTVR